VSWTVWTEEIPARTVLAMPPGLAKATTNFLRALALEAGGAVDLDRQPPGDPMDDTGLRYSLEVPGEPVILEYLIAPREQQIRIAVLVWMH
jgi:hypothetical protein